MRKMRVVVMGLLCFTLQRAHSQSFEQQALQINKQVSGGALQLRQSMAASRARQDDQDAALNPADALDESKVGVAARFISIKPGTFDMGSPGDERWRSAHEVQHRVTLTRGFEMQATEVTQLQYYLVMGRNPAEFQYKDTCDEGNFMSIGRSTLCRNHPVETVSWNGVQRFILKLNQIQSKCLYRLPTEAEWEYAARGGMSSRYPYSFGSNDANELNNYGWYEENSENGTGPNFISTHAVARKKPNPWGLYDMHGNVVEWVQDWYGSYPATAVINPTGPATGSIRIYRGGCFGNHSSYLRSAERYILPDVPGSQDPDFAWAGAGFRLVRSCR